jgi:hypothetical protein
MSLSTAVARDAMAARMSADKNEKTHWFIKLCFLLQADIDADIRLVFNFRLKDTYELMIEGGNWAEKFFQKDSISRASQRDYQNKALRVVEGRIPNSGSKRTIGAYRSALKDTFACALLFFRDRVQKTQPFETGNTNELEYFGPRARRLLAILSDWEIVRWDQGRVIDLQSWKGLNLEAPVHHTSKAEGLIAFCEEYENFRDSMFESMRLNSKYMTPLCVMLAVGPRLNEFVRRKDGQEPIVVTIAGPDHIEIAIRGSKCGHGDNNGQPMRWVKIKVGSPETKLLQELVKQEPGCRLLVEVKSKAAFAAKITDMSRRLFPSRYILSANSLRHVAMADAKFYRGREDVAFAFGHASDRTQSTWYLNWAKAGSSWRNPIDEALGNNPVRNRYRDYRQIKAVAKRLCGERAPRGRRLPRKS